MTKTKSLQLLVITSTACFFVLLFGAYFVYAEYSPSDAHPREKRQIVYAKPLQTTNSSPEVDGEEHEEHEHFERVVPRKPLPQRAVYPGDLSRYFIHHDTRNLTESSTPSLVSEPKDTEKKRSKRGAYLRDSLSEIEAEAAKRSQQRISKSRFRLSESRRQESFQPAEIPSEMSFSGAGYLRSDDTNTNVLPAPHSSYTPVGNRRAANDFQAAFHPEYGRDIEEIQFDDEIRPPGTLVDIKPNMETRNLQMKDSKAEVGTPSVPVFPATPQKAASGAIESFLPAVPSQYSNIPGMNSFFYSYPFSSSGQLATAADSTGFDIHESLLKNHRLNAAASAKHATLILAPEKQSQKTTHKSDSFIASKTQKRRKKRSSSSDANIEDNKGNEGLETLRDYSYSRSDDQYDSSSRFLPITGTFEGGALHLSLPYYGGPMSPPPSYTSGPPVPYNSYGPRRPQPRHFGSGDNYFHPSEARRYSYGILGSGNFEVIRGGIYSGGSPRGVNTITFDDGRAPYGGEMFNNYGTTEIIIDGPVQGFQGFDNFPAHLINALSKHSEVAVHGPEFRQDNLDSMVHEKTHPSSRSI